MAGPGSHLIIFVLTFGDVLGAYLATQADAPQPVTRNSSLSGSSAFDRSLTDPRPANAAVRGLIDADGRVRDAARRSLLSLTLADLSNIRESVNVLPAEARASTEVGLVLRDAVTHMHVRDAKERFIRTTTDPDDFRDPDAFLGFQIARSKALDALIDEVDTDGVCVGPPMIGFNAYEVLREGDLLVGIRAERGITSLHSFNELSAAMWSFQPGQAVELLLVRGGRVERIPFRMDRRIQETSERWRAMDAEARRTAEATWVEMFEPALSESTGGTAAAG